MELINLKGYKTSQDFSRLKELLDKGYWVVILWEHDTTKNIFPDIAKRVPHIDGGSGRGLVLYRVLGIFPDA